MTKFKIGDKVTLRESSIWNNGSSNNPTGIEGEIIGEDDTLHWYVYWGNGTRNGYNEHDLDPVSAATPCEELGYKVGDRFTVNDDYDGDVFSQGSVIELYEDDKTHSPLFKLITGECNYSHADGKKGAYVSLGCITKLAPANTPLTKQDVMGKYIPITSEEHFYYVYDLLVELGCREKYTSRRKDRTKALVVDEDQDILRVWEGSLTEFEEEGYTQLEIPLPASSTELPASFKLSCGDKPEVRAWLKSLGYTWQSGDDLTEDFMSDRTYLFMESEDKKVTSCHGQSCYDEQEEVEINPVFSEREITVTESYVSGFEVVNKMSEKELQMQELVDKLQSQLNEAQTELDKIKGE